MGFLSTALRSESASDQQLQTVGGGFFDFLGFGNSEGTRANSRTALTLSPFFNGIDQLSNDIAKLPKSILLKDGRNRTKQPNHPASLLISQRPSGLMIAFDLWKVVDINVKLKGAAFVEIIRNSATGEAQNLVFLGNRTDVDVLKDKKNLKYHYCYKGRMIDGEDMLHFKGFSLDGENTCGVITFAAAQLGVLLDSQSYAGDVYTNKGLSFGVAETEKSLTNEAKARISEGISKALSSKSRHKVAMLDEDLKYKSISITPAEAQFLETNKNGVAEVARWLNIPPHKLKDLTNANYSNVYQMSIEYVQDSILPWTIRYEQELNSKLFPADAAGSLYCRFNIASLLRGDLDMQQKFYTAMVYAGIYTRNEIRELEDRNPIDGLDEPLQPVNMQALSVAMKLLKDQENGGNNSK